MSLARSPVWLFVTLLGGFVVQQSGLAGEPERGYRRWAILGTSAVEETGLTDVLTAELSKRQGLELVERQTLAAIAKELELSACFGSDAAGKRLRLGQLSGAEALVLLSLEERESDPLRPGQSRAGSTPEKRQFVRLVISECRYGARLRLEYFPYVKDRREELARQAAQIVDETRGRFAAGVRQVLGVSHFLAKNLAHDYDHLQAGYAYLLESALMGYPGVAVVEIEEAQAIRRELDLAGQELKDRVVPLFVDGDYSMTSAKPGDEPTVRLSVRATDGKQVRLEVQKQGLSLSETAELLRESLARQIVHLAQERAGAGLNRQAQHTWLSSRAKTFSNYSAYEQSTGLREAALLLNSNDADQRLALIGDYLRWNRRLWDYPGPPERLQKISAEKRKNSEAALGHFEHLLRSRALNPCEAEIIASRLISGVRLGPAPQSDVSGLIWKIYPLFPKLDPRLREGGVGAAIQECVGADYAGLRSPLQQYDGWTSNAATLLVFDLYGPPKYAPDRLDDLFRFLTEVADPKLPMHFMGLIASDVPPWNFHEAIKQGRFKEEDVRAFADRLMRSGTPANLLYGRILLFSRRVYGKQGRPLDTDSLREIDELVETVRKLDNGDPGYISIFLLYKNYFLGRMRMEILRVLGGATQAKRHLLPENPIPPIDAKYRLRVAPVEGIKHDWIGLLKCTESLDVAWSRNCVYAVRGKGVIQRILQLPSDKSADNDRILSAQWDGENLWIACLASGIHVLSPDGEVRGRLGETQGLPPYGKERIVPFSPRRSREPWPLVLQPIAPGKCVAIGCPIGPQPRLWLALLSRESQGDARISVHVFHTATHRPRYDSDSDEDPEEAFVPDWLTFYSHPKTPEERMLLVGRQGRGGSMQAIEGRKPLAINLQTLAVSFFPERFGERTYGMRLCHAERGRILSFTRRGLALYSPPADGIQGPWQRSVFVEVPFARDPSFETTLLTENGVLYVPGTLWRRIDSRTWTMESIRSPIMPEQPLFEDYATSAHYGLVAWKRGSLFQLIVEPQPPADADLEVLYPEIPAACRASHHCVVLAVRGLGGSVETRWGICHNSRQYSSVTNRMSSGHPLDPPIEWRTIVYLPEAWKGGDDGLKHLEGLYNLRDLYLFRANVGNAGLETIGRIKTLQSLYLVETKATDQGLSSLRGLDNLIYLRLEGTVGGQQFSDQGLKLLPPLPRLEKITLYGDGFTDEGLAVLESLQELKSLVLLNTRVTQSSLEKVGKPRHWDWNFRQEDFTFRFD